MIKVIGICDENGSVINENLCTIINLRSITNINLFYRNIKQINACQFWIQHEQLKLQCNIHI